MRGDATRRAAAEGGETSAAPPVAPAPAQAVVDEHELETLEAEARFHRDRLALYRARVYAVKPTSGTRLRELEHRAAGAVARLERARRHP
jgi:hypothetical protein